ncbi:hypothetical protein [Flavobacterium sp.]|uniref:hypothetical protein n=1 Tax=Flavobacterium sp. TaxID=239 RepID=UPI002B4B4529|nr:hypothetical protein [Flavobacterium sp.]HLF52607.1 hypothetical protein [Flavobacterium sp.]
MKRLLTLLFIIILTSCGEKSKNATDTKSIEAKNNDLIHVVETSRQIFEFKKPTVLIVELDSLETEKLKNSDEENFYTAADDIIWYNAKLLKKMDSLKIPVVQSDKDTIEIKTPHATHIIVKDSTFSLYTYFYFDGNKVSKQDVLDLLDQ